MHSSTDQTSTPAGPTRSASPFAFNGPITIDNLDALFDHHRAITGGWSMEEPSGGGAPAGGEGDKGGSGSGGANDKGGSGGGSGGSGDGAKGGEKTFTQTEVNQLIKGRAERMLKDLTGGLDIETLKGEAEKVGTLEERLAAMEKTAAQDKADALRARVAAEFGVSTKRGEKGEASDADLFLTASDEDGLRAQAQRLAGRGPTPGAPFVPAEGSNQGGNQSPGTDAKRSWLRGLTNKN